MVRTLLALALLTGCERGRITPEGAAPRTITVCDLFTDLASYRGKMASVRGIYYYGLRQTGCPEFVTGTHKWPAAVDLVGSDYTPEGEERVAFRTDLESWNKLDDTTRRAGKERDRVEVWATAVGQVRARKTYLPLGPGHPDVVSGGYGHLGVFAAQLVVKSFSDIVVKPKGR